MEQYKRGLIILVALICLSSVASAEILFTQPKTLYNLGDNFDITITVASVNEVDDFMTAQIICGSKTIEIYRSPLSVNSDERKDIQISTKLGRFLLGNVGGNCFIRTKFAEQEASSPKFEVTSGIDVHFEISGAAFDPNERVTVTGEAKKRNGEPLNGFVELNLEQIDLTLTEIISDGNFNFNFTIPQDAFSGSYDAEIRAYEKDSKGAITNDGLATGKFRVNQVIKEISIALEKDDVTPGEITAYQIIVTDQAGERVDTDAGITIYSPNKQILEKNLIKSGTKESIEFKTNSTPGNWEVEARINDLVARRSFAVTELRKITLDLENSTLVVKNIGNVVYQGPVQIKIGGVTEVKDININIGEEKRFRLVAPTGEYSISAGDSSNIQTLGTSFLTGKAISVEEAGRGIYNNLLPLIMIIVLLLVGVGGMFLYRYVSNKRALHGFNSTKRFPVIKDSEPSYVRNIKEKDTTLIQKGEKQESTVIAVNIKNMSSVSANSSSAEAVDSALWKAKEEGARVYTDDNFRIIVLSPSITKQQDNLVKGARIAQAVERSLRDFNNRSASKINYGIGLHEGNLIVENAEGKFRFISLDNTIAAAKRLSQQSSTEIIISEKVHRKTIGKIKTSKIAEKIWKIDKIVDRTAHEDYISKFKQRHAKS